MGRSNAVVGSKTGCLVGMLRSSAPIWDNSLVDGLLLLIAGMPRNSVAISPSSPVRMPPPTPRMVFAAPERISGARYPTMPPPTIGRISVAVNPPRRDTIPPGVLTFIPVGVVSNAVSIPTCPAKAAPINQGAARTPNPTALAPSDAPGARAAVIAGPMLGPIARATPPVASPTPVQRIASAGFSIGSVTAPAVNANWAVPGIYGYFVASFSKNVRVVIIFSAACSFDIPCIFPRPVRERSLNGSFTCVFQTVSSPPNPVVPIFAASTLTFTPSARS